MTKKRSGYNRRKRRYNYRERKAYHFGRGYAFGAYDYKSPYKDKRLSASFVAGYLSAPREKAYRIKGTDKAY